MLTLKPAASNAIVVWKIPVAGERALDGAAMYLILLAYPDDEQKRRETFEAVLAYRIRTWREHNRVTGRAVRGEVHDPRAQALLSRWPMREMWGALGMLNKRLIDRLRAAELLAYFGAVSFVKQKRLTAGRYRIAIVPDDARLTATEEGGVQVIKSWPRLFPTIRSELVKIAAERWHTEPGNVRKNIMTPVKPVAHVAIALRETLLARRAMARSTTVDGELDGDQLPQLLCCPQWLLPAIEDAQIVARDWNANAISRPSWQSIDPAGFIELQPAVDGNCSISERDIRCTPAKMDSRINQEPMP
jgi:hypothetical protein